MPRKRLQTAIVRMSDAARRARKKVPGARANKWQRCCCVPSNREKGIKGYVCEPCTAARERAPHKVVGARNTLLQMGCDVEKVDKLMGELYG